MGQECSSDRALLHASNGPAASERTALRPDLEGSFQKAGEIGEGHSLMLEPPPVRSWGLGI
eukprot:CAMPEP_0206434874 /NCGR_PEP_ID=MMETSP0324_2-20121206/9472_1 /ASSEMBLY_ACC=CAM_ASM_000836 /TAXON_ID=2866 /ORGANISM="Crypthecodinium cohnii, Strain Seligo" /LENGTH=60 /DNA_ID=CAMNT_0053901581 /DNA_START=600 /DNA_END=782 /DNA_ORIENTATION=+